MIVVVRAHEEASIHVTLHDTIRGAHRSAGNILLVCRGFSVSLGSCRYLAGQGWNEAYEALFAKERDYPASSRRS